MLHNIRNKRGEPCFPSALTNVTFTRCFHHRVGQLLHTKEKHNKRSKHLFICSKTISVGFLTIVFKDIYCFDPTDDCGVSKLHQSWAICCGYGPWTQREWSSVYLKKKIIRKTRFIVGMRISAVSHLCSVLWFWTLSAPVHRAGSFLSEKIRFGCDLAADADISDKQKGMAIHSFNLNLSYAFKFSLTRKLLWYSTGSAVLEWINNKLFVNRYRNRLKYIYTLWQIRLVLRHSYSHIAGDITNKAVTNVLY